MIGFPWTEEPFRPARRFLVGLDLGQTRDYTAMAVLERLGAVDEQPVYWVSHAARAERGTRYPAIVARTRERLCELAAIRPAPQISLALDWTGVGRAVRDMVTDADMPADVVPITIHGGDAVTQDGEGFRVPKRDLVAAVSATLQSGRLKIEEAVPEATLLTNELVGFRANINARGHDTYGNATDWRTEDHDDLVLAVAMAVWLGMREENAGTLGPADPGLVAAMADLLAVR